MRLLTFCVPNDLFFEHTTCLRFLHAHVMHLLVIWGLVLLGSSQGLAISGDMPLFFS